MDRASFERLRNLGGKTIQGDIVLRPKKDRAGVYAMENIIINNAIGTDTRLKVEWLEQTDAKCINVHIKGTGPICRLEVDATPHAPCGRSHKHSLQKPTCPENNLNLGMYDRDDLSGKSIQEVFTDFCTSAHITHNGTLTIEGITP
jgi:hypothetical protein